MRMMTYRHVVLLEMRLQRNDRIAHHIHHIVKSITYHIRHKMGREGRRGRVGGKHPPHNRLIPTDGNRLSTYNRTAKVWSRRYSQLSEILLGTVSLVTPEKGLTRCGHNHFGASWRVISRSKSKKVPARPPHFAVTTDGQPQRPPNKQQQRTAHCLLSLPSSFQEIHSLCQKNKNFLA